MSIYKSLKGGIARLVSRSPLQYFPVRVRQGLARGARWTLLPFSSNWRLGGEDDLERFVAAIGSLHGKACWDLGAHFGIHTVGLARQVGEAGEVSAFEPDTVAFRRLERHVRMNRLGNIRLFNVAASDRDGNLDLIVVRELGSTVTHAKYEDERVNVDTVTISAPCARLDTMVDAGMMRPPFLMKVDVEGHGAKAIAGALRGIESTKPFILFSVHSSYEWLDTAKLLAPLGYFPWSEAGVSANWDVWPGFGTVGIVPGDSVLAGRSQ